MVLPPSRPDLWQLSAITTQLKLNPRHQPVAVLGSTPEFRDLLAELQFENIHIFERNETFHDLASKERIYKNRELIIWGDWLETLHKVDTKYAAILSDFTSGNINYANRPRFYNGVSRILHEDGLFFDRVLAHPIPHESLDTLSEKYNTLPLNLTTINHFSCEFLFCSELLSLDNIVDSTKFYKILQDRLQTRRLKKFLEYCPLITPSDCVWWYGRSWTGLSEDYQRTLEIIDSAPEPATSPYARRANLLISRKRSNVQE